MENAVNHTKLEKLLLGAARVFNSTLEYEKLMELVLNMVTTAVNAEAALVFRVDHKRTDMKIRYMVCPDCQMKVFNHELGSGVIGWVANYREPVIINDTSADTRVDGGVEGKIDRKIKSLISVPLIGKGQMIGVIEAINKVEGEFTKEDLDTLLGLSNQMAVAIDNANLYRAVKQEALEKEVLYKIGIKLSSSLDLDEVLSLIMSSLKQVVDYDAGGVFVINTANNEIDSIYPVGYDLQSIPSLHTKMGEGLVGHAAKTGEPIIVTDVSKDNRYINLRDETKSEVVVPIRLNDKTIGVINLESDYHDTYEEHHLSLMMVFASQAAISIERTRLHKKILSSDRIEQQLAIARQIQRSFLPGHDPKIKGYDICGRNYPSGEVGGDYYDFINIVEGQMGIAIADVVGKGIPAALIMASFRSSLIAEIRNNYSIRTICRKVNSLMVESLNPGNFVTAVYGVMDSKNHILTFANCGHNQPILVKQNNQVEFLKEGGPVMGVTLAASFEERPIFLNPGEIVVFYTDGVTEVFNADGKEFGVPMLTEVIRQNREKSSREIHEVIYQAVRDFAGPQHVFDDLTMVVLKRLK